MDDNPVYRPQPRIGLPLLQHAETSVNGVRREMAMVREWCLETPSRKQKDALRMLQLEVPWSMR
jgi:hypothetical protein